MTPARSKAQKRRTRNRIMLFVCILGFALCAGLFLHRLGEYRQADSAYAALTQETHAAPTTEKNAAPIDVDFNTLRQVNPDIISWLYADGIGVNYPVLQGENNDTYLYRLYDGQKSIAGSLFFDERCAPSMTDRHLIIYGHKLRNGTMFGSLNRYADPAFYRSYPTFYLLTPEKNYRIEVLSAYFTKADGSAYQTDFPDTGAWNAYLDDILQQALYPAAPRPTAEAQLLTLSTCSYESENARFVVHGVMSECTPD